MPLSPEPNASTPNRVPEPGYLAARESASWLDLSSEAIFELVGEERKTFLNAYNTQDIKNLAAGRIAPGSFLTQKGKLVSESWILNLADKILLLFPPGFGGQVEKHLTTFLMFSSVTLKDASQNYAHFALLGPKASEFWQEITAQAPPSEAGILQTSTWEGAPLLAFTSSRFGVEALEAILPSTMGVAFQSRLLSLQERGLEKLSEEARETLRLEAGIPKMGVDMSEENLIAEVGLDTVATSFNKGCYLGQETTARVQSRGHVNRRLTRLRLSQAYSGPLPVEIFQGEKKVGTLTSSAESPKFGGVIGLGTVQLNAWENSEMIFVSSHPENISLQKL